MKKTIIAAVLIILATVSYSQEENEGEKEKLANSIAKESTYYGLIIGINQYNDDSIPDLVHPISDAEKLHQTLISSYNFEEGDISFLRNATRTDIIVSLDNLIQVVTPDDNLLIYFAGHGDWDSDKQMGYWLPSNASRSFIDEWMSNKEIVDYLKRINSRHTLLIVDAGFAGSIFKARAAFADAPNTIEKLYELTSRKAMTSGNLTIVPDESVFSKYLIKRLIENEKAILTSDQLFSSMKMAILNNSPNIPQYGTIQNVGDQSGDFIFFKPD